MSTSASMYRSSLEDASYDAYPKSYYGNRYDPYTSRSSNSQPCMYRSSLEDASYDAYPKSYYGNHYDPYTSRSSSNSQPNDHRSSSSQTNRSVAKYGDLYRSEDYPKALTEMFEANQCVLCATELSSPIIAKMHYSGNPHQKKINAYMSNYRGYCRYALPSSTPEPEKSSTLADYCEVCDVRLPSTSDKLMHYVGKNHQKNSLNPANPKRKKKVIETIDLSDPFGIGTSFSITEGETANDFKKAFVCEICNVTAVSQDQLNQHLSGKKHKEKAEKKESDIPKKNKPFVCQLCDVALETKQLYKIHLDGKRHRKNLTKKAEIQNYCNAVSKCKYCPFIGDLDDHECNNIITEEDLVYLEDSYLCHYCNMVFQSQDEYEEHTKTSKHTLSVLNSEKGDVMIYELEHLYCHLCKKQCNEGKEFVDHMFTQKHNKLSQEKVFLETNSLMVCSVCRVTFPEPLREEHLQDRNHLKAEFVKESVATLTELANKKHDSMSFRCDNCKEGPFNFVQYSEHIIGNAHIQRRIDCELMKMQKKELST